MGLKRLLDIVVSSLILVLTSPIFLIASLAVRVTSVGPVFFSQRRLGGGGREIRVLKFRTMRVNEDSDTTWSVLDDDRITRVGALLRKSCLDELPQVLNVLRGDMSLVGPRPERPYFSAVFSESVPGYAERLRVPAGLTGWAQIHGLRGDTSIVDRARFDNDYIENWSLFLDFKILIRTAVFLFKWILLGRAPTPADLSPSEIGEDSTTDETRSLDLLTGMEAENRAGGLLVGPLPEGLQSTG